MDLKQLIVFGIENSQEPVIKNPVLRAALEGPSITAQEPRMGLKPGGLVEPGVVNYAKPENIKRGFKTYDKYPGVYIRDNRIRFAVDYIDNEGKKQKYTSKEIFSSATKANEARIKQIAALEKGLGIDAGTLFKSTETRTSRLHLPKGKTNYISLSDLRALLGEGAADMRTVGGSKDTVLARASAKLLDQTKVVSPGGQNYFFYKNPTEKELNLLKQYVGKKSMTPEVIERIKLLKKDSYTAQILKSGELPMVGEGKNRVLDPDFIKHYKKRYGTLDKYVYGLMKYSQALDGDRLIGINDEILTKNPLKANNKLASNIRGTFLEMPYGSENASLNTIRKAVYKGAMHEISRDLGTFAGTFEDYKNQIRRVLNNKYKLKGMGLHIDELIGVSSSFRNKTAPYAVFTQLATKELNEGILKDYQKVLSNHTAALRNEIKNNSRFIGGKWEHSKEASRIKNHFNKNILPNLKNIDQLKGSNIVLPEMTLAAPTSKTLGGGAGRLAQLEKAGLDFTKFYKQEGFGYKMPKNVATQKELFTQLANTDNVKKFKKTFSGTFQNLSPRSIMQLGRLNDCTDFNKGGSIITCLTKKFNEAPEKFLQRAAPLAKDNVNLFKWFKNGRKIARGTGVFLAWEAAFAPIIAGWSALEGESGARMINEIAYGIPFIGETEKEEWKREAGGDELAYKMKKMGEIEEQELPSLYQQLNQVINDMSHVPGKSPQQLWIEKDIEEKKLELQKLYNTPEFYAGPAGSYVNEPVIQDAYALEQLTTAKIAADKAERKKERFDWLKENKIYADQNWQSQVQGRAEGGILSLKKKW